MESVVTSIVQSLSFLERVVEARLEYHFKQTGLPHPRLDTVLMHHLDDPSPFSGFIREFRPSYEEYVVLLTALVPHLYASFFDNLFKEYLLPSVSFPAVGGVRLKDYRGFLPTGETTLFILAGEELEMRLNVQQIFGKDHSFARQNILWLAEPDDGAPQMAGRLVLHPDYVELFLTGKAAAPAFNLKFPAKRIETRLDWDDLVLNADTVQQLQELKTWLQHHHTLMTDWGMAKALKPGYRALFHGPPGTGKTLTAGLLGKANQLEVYRIDLSMVVSKYIGETEKNLANLFAKAEGKNWILFFDEADALFGKRTSVRDAHDKYANQEVSYLLQRVEDYNGLVILASNFKSNIDEAFVRRFQSIIHFPMPSPAERQCLWQKAFPAKAALADDVDFVQLAQKYELSGANIMNVVQYCCLQALDRDDTRITAADILKGIRREYSKEERLAP